MKTISVNQDLLGIVAIGSIIGNLAQANEMGAVKTQRNKLSVMYNKLTDHYRTLYHEYRAFLLVNEQLRSEVVSLRTENSRLLNQIVLKGSAK